MASSNNHGYAKVSELSDFAKSQHTRSSLHSLSFCLGGSLKRFDSWLDTFEKIVSNSGFSDEKMVLELYKKMTDRAQKVTKYVLESGADEYATVKERLIDHFHGDETAEKYLKKLRDETLHFISRNFGMTVQESFDYSRCDASSTRVGTN
jgi:hypothetical protein